MGKKDGSFYSLSGSLKQALSEFPAGIWVAIAEDQQRVVGSGPTATRAEKRAAVSGHKPTLLLQVPDGGFRARETNGNGKGDGKAAMPLNLPSFYRGIYKKVARKLGCDPSYLSRVARGERSSDVVSQTLQSELSHAVTLTSKNGRHRREHL